MDIIAAAPLNNHRDETHRQVSLFHAAKCRTESCVWWTWLPMSSSLSGTLSSGNMEVESVRECELKGRRKLLFMDLRSAFHECDSVELNESL